jgi:hypothetical protein
MLKLGQVVIKRGAMAKLSHEDVMNALGRHSRGDWGGVGEEDKKENMSWL